MRLPSLKRTVFFPFLAALLWCAVGFNCSYTPVQFFPPKLTVPLADRDSIRAFLRASSHSFKLTFVNSNDGSVYVVDFSTLELDPKSGSQTPKVIQLKRDANRNGFIAESPLLSPDGSLVTYHLRSGNNAVVPYVQPALDGAEPVALAPLGSDPHFWKDSTGGLYVVYSGRFMTAVNELQSLSGVATWRQRIDAASGAPQGKPVALVNKPFNGGLSKNGRFLCTGYADGAIYDLQDAKLGRIDAGMQICNPSISPDTLYQDWMLFLPFSGMQNLGFASGVAQLGLIGMHEYLLMADRSNTVRWCLRKPAGRGEWQDPEWTNEFDYLLALLKTDADDKNPFYDCCLIRRTDNALMNLTVGDYKMEMTAKPSFWIGR